MVRNGKETRLAVEDLVIGDVVMVNAGDKVPADIRILYSNLFKVYFLSSLLFVWLLINSLLIG